jgi:hypothetical protein
VQQRTNEIGRIASYWRDGLCDSFRSVHLGIRTVAFPDECSGRSVLSYVCGDHHGYLLFCGYCPTARWVYWRLARMSLSHQVSLSNLRWRCVDLGPEASADGIGKNIYLPLVLSPQYASCSRIVRSCRRPHRQLRYQAQSRPGRVSRKSELILGYGPKLT